MEFELDFYSQASNNKVVDGLNPKETMLARTWQLLLVWVHVNKSW